MSSSEVPTISRVPSVAPMVKHLILRDGLPERVKKLRTERGYSVRDMGRITGKNYMAVHRFETRQSAPDLTYLLAVCILFGVSPNEMLGWDSRWETIEGARKAMEEERSQGVRLTPIKRLWE